MKTMVTTRLAVRLPAVLRIVVTAAAAAVATTAAATAAAPAPAPAPALTIHYSEHAPLHVTTANGELAGDAAAPVLAALNAAGIRYAVQRTPAKQQLIILDDNRVAACMLSWVALPGREQRGKFSAVIYREGRGGNIVERRLWCTKSVPDDVLQRFNAALVHAMPR